MKGLKAFVEQEGLAYGVANEFEVTDSFLQEARQRIEEAYSSWTQ